MFVFILAKDEQVCCTANHEGRKVARSILPMHIDQLFTMLFTSSKFSLDFHTLRKTTGNLFIINLLFYSILPIMRKYYIIILLGIFTSI